VARRRHGAEPRRVAVEAPESGGNIVGADDLPREWRAGWREALDGLANAVRLQLHALAYNLGNFMRTLAMPKTAEPWSLTSPREKLIKIDAKVVNHGRYLTLQMAEVAAPRQMFVDILLLIARLRAPPAPA
jgi:hypothetical protein